ncbi:MAG: cation transporter [Eubacteriaceae bacterium]|nr:cation transporter [Eubacteriaceae bacterium]
MEKTILKVDSMDCEHCMEKVTNAVNSVHGVAGAEAELETRTVTINYDPSIASLEAIKASIVDAGYEVA